VFQIELAKGTESEGLPEMLATLLRQNLEQKPYKLKDFNALDIVVGLKVTDLEVEMTLVFRNGRLVIYDGLVIDPKLLITTDSEGMFDLNLIHIRFGLPWYLDAQGRKVLKSLLSGRLKIRGMLTHMGSLTRLTKIMSVK
jgi:hypothetical protein